MRVATIKENLVTEVTEIGSTPISSFPDILLVECPEWVTIGAGYANGVFAMAPDYLANLKIAKIKSLYKSYSTAIQMPVAYMATTFQADTVSQDVLSKSLSPGVLPADFVWLDANNVWVPVTMLQLRGLAAAMLAQGFTAFKMLQERKAAVKAATTVAAVDLVVW